MSIETLPSFARMTKHVTELYRTHSAALMEILKFNDIECWVFLYLFYKKIYEKDPSHSGYQIYKDIKAIITSSQFLGKPRISDKQVYEALDQLAKKGYVTRREVPMTQLKVRKGLKKVGRPPVYFYEARSILAITEKVKEDLREKERRIMKTFEPLREMEEAAGGNHEEVKK